MHHPIGQRRDAACSHIHAVGRRLTAQIGQVRDDVNKRIDILGSRVTNLEAEDKKLIEKTAKLGALGGGVGGALAAAAVELIKRM
ncbi:MAG: hypothetical protein BSR46_17470 [Candidatus Dactylopiibacterium carminicum]|nr:MAG: hypothetical protein BSR46_17470 [Candidatus Dactylopiibacterium carminicum]